MGAKAGFDPPRICSCPCYHALLQPAMSQPPLLTPPAAASAKSPLTRRRWLWLAGAGALAAAGAAGLALRRAVPGQPPAGDEGLDEVCIVAPPTPYDPASGLPPEAPRPVPPDARCPVCGMFPARNPRWAAQIIYTDHSAQYFDSPVNLLLFLANVSRYSPNRSEADVQSRWVTDAASGQWTPLEQAWFVHGSEVRGPMRTPDLPAFAREEDAARFAAKRGGQALPWARITPQILEALSKERGGPHNHASHGAAAAAP